MFRLFATRQRFLTVFTALLFSILLATAQQPTTAAQETATRTEATAIGHPPADVDSWMGSALSPIYINNTLWIAQGNCISSYDALQLPQLVQMTNSCIEDPIVNMTVDTDTRLFYVTTMYNDLLIRIFQPEVTSKQWRLTNVTGSRSVVVSKGRLYAVHGWNVEVYDLDETGMPTTLAYVTPFNQGPSEIALVDEATQTFVLSDDWFPTQIVSFGATESTQIRVLDEGCGYPQARLDPNRTMLFVCDDLYDTSTWDNLMFDSSLKSTFQTIFLARDFIVASDDLGIRMSKAAEIGFSDTTAVFSDPRLRKVNGAVLTDQNFIVITTDMGIFVFKLDALDRPSLVTVADGPPRLETVTLAGDKLVGTGYRSKQLILLDPATKSMTLKPFGTPYHTCVSWMPELAVIVVCDYENKAVQLHSARGEFMYSIPVNDLPVGAISYGRDLYVSLMYDGFQRIRFSKENIAYPQSTLYPWDRYLINCTKLDIDPTGQYLAASCNDVGVQLWALGKYPHVLGTSYPYHRDDPIAVSSDGTVFLGYGQYLVTYRVSPMEEKWLDQGSWIRTEWPITDLELTKDGQAIYLGTEGYIQQVRVVRDADSSIQLMPSISRHAFVGTLEDMAMNPSEDTLWIAGSAGLSTMKLKHPAAVSKREWLAYLPSLER